MKITPQRLVDIAVQKLEYRRLWNPEFVLIAIKGTEGKFERVGLLALQKHVTFRMNGVEVNMILDIYVNVLSCEIWSEFRKATKDSLMVYCSSDGTLNRAVASIMYRIVL